MNVMVSYSDMRTAIAVWIVNAFLLSIILLLFQNLVPVLLHCVEFPLNLKSLNLTYYDIAKKNYILPSFFQFYINSWINVPRQKKSIGINKICSDMARYGSKYICSIVDNETRQLFEVLDSRSKSNLIQYFTKIPRAEKRTEDTKLFDSKLFLPFKMGLICLE